MLFLGMDLKIILLQAFLFACCIPFSSFSQDNTDRHKVNMEIPEVALRGLVSGSATDVDLYSLASDEAGNSLDFSNAESNRIWINYSFVKSGTSKKRKVIAMLEGELPEGLRLVVEASAYSGDGEGALGKTAGQVTLSNQPADVIVYIGSCYTGKGINNGHSLNYRLERENSSDSYALIFQQQTSVNVIYTLTDYN